MISKPMESSAISLQRFLYINECQKHLHKPFTNLQKSRPLVFSHEPLEMPLQNIKQWGTHVVYGGTTHKACAWFGCRGL